MHICSPASTSVTRTTPFDNHLTYATNYSFRFAHLWRGDCNLHRAHETRSRGVALPLARRNWGHRAGSSSFQSFVIANKYAPSALTGEMLLCSHGGLTPVRASIPIFQPGVIDMVPNRPTSFRHLSIRTIRIALVLSLVAVTAGLLSSTSFASSLGQRLIARVAGIVSASQAASTSQHA